MPIGCPSQSPEPKSACTGASSPIERMIAAELGIAAAYAAAGYLLFRLLETASRRDAVLDAF